MPSIENLDRIETVYRLRGFTEKIFELSKLHKPRPVIHVVPMVIMLLLLVSRAKLKCLESEIYKLKQLSRFYLG